VPVAVSNVASADKKLVPVAVSNAAPVNTKPAPVDNLVPEVPVVQQERLHPLEQCLPATKKLYYMGLTLKIHRMLNGGAILEPELREAICLL
jgi:hypothetical protein